PTATAPPVPMALSPPVVPLQLRKFSLLAGRKLLLADDSVTVQKVIDLTFADEGVEVIIAGDGEEAIEKVEQLLPDVVLVDVFMPVFNGYEVCEYIKTSEKLKHIPVMLLVGSFEPFDEAEARRVGANDILTKPFQSIRRLIDKVGELVSVKPPETEAPTAELPIQPEEPPKEPEETRLSTAEIEISTADTLQLPADMAPEASPFTAEHYAVQPTFSENKMESPTQTQTRTSSNATDTLLDLGDLELAQTLEADDFELELDLDEVDAAPASAPLAATALAESQVSVSAATGWEGSSRARVIAPDNGVVVAEPFAAETVTEEVKPAAKTFQVPMSGSVNVQDLSPEMIDAIARRAVEHLSERVVQEIAWEVVPQLAELLIKRQLEEKESQPK
ncbi:MAG TPA: response regulator, partial [Pyrinomonadaceae bacterium]|nr:response regulator [Pyrinomonadaceae bacterium]